ncbi:hypothetical protein J6590_093588 [Homalodisca vitripennis]|nr:hypothetical protein J6590_093588 [Homalodisca vitripennis]
MVKGTSVPNFKFLALLEDSPSARWGLRPQAPMMYACKFGDKRDLDSPSARWGLRPQAPMMYACKFGDKRDLVIGKIWTRGYARKFPEGGLMLPVVKTAEGYLVIPGTSQGGGGIRATTYGLDATEPQTKIYKRKSSKFDKIFQFESMFRVDRTIQLWGGVMTPEQLDLRAQSENHVNNRTESLTMSPVVAQSDRPLLVGGSGSE